MLTIIFVVGLFPLSFFDIRLLITSLISSISSHHFCIPAPPWTVFQSNLRYDYLPTHATDISINYILYICPWSTLSSTSARACTCSGEWGSAACTHGNPSKLRITLITPITNKSQWYAVPFFILKEKSTCYYIDKQYFLISSSFTIDETQLIFSDMLQVYRQDHNEWHAYAKINYYATLSMICTFSFDLYTRWLLLSSY